jgi:hypothetical protein
MPNVRLTTFFEQDQYGWTESLWTQTSFSTLAAAETNAANYLNARVKLLAPPCKITEGRLSFIDGSRETKVVDPKLYVHTYNPPPLSNGEIPASDWSFDAIKIRCEDDGGHRKILYLSGYPFIVSSTNPVDTPGVVLQGDFLKNYRAWIQLLTITWGWRGKKLAADGQPTYPAVSVVHNPALNNDIQVSFVAPGVPVAVGDVVQLTRFPHLYGSPQQINGLWRVENIDTTTAPGFQRLTFYYSSAINLQNLRSFGYAMLNVYRVYPIFSAVATGITHRKRGGRINLPLGRRHLAK